MNYNNVNTICPFCKSPLIVNPTDQYERCPFCNNRFETQRAIAMSYSMNNRNYPYAQKSVQRGYLQNNQSIHRANSQKTDNLKIALWIVFLCLGAILLYALLSSTARINNNNQMDRNKLSAVNDSEIKMKDDSNAFIGKNYKEVSQKLKSYGFKNVKLLAVESPGSFGVIDRVKSVTINGKADFKSGDSFKSNSLVRIYYYDEEPQTTALNKSVPTSTTTVKTNPTQNDNENTTTPPQGVTPEFKQLMDNYEAFFDEYIAFMEKLENDSDEDDLSSLEDYFSMIEKESRIMSEMEAIDESELSDADAAYYLEVTMRIYQKLMKVTFSMF